MQVERNGLHIVVKAVEPSIASKFIATVIVEEKITVTPTRIPYRSEANIFDSNLGWTVLTFLSESGEARTYSGTWVSHSQYLCRRLSNTVAPYANPHRVNNKVVHSMTLITPDTAAPMARW